MTAAGARPGRGLPRIRLQTESLDDRLAAATRGRSQAVVVFAQAASGSTPRLRREDQDWITGRGLAPSVRLRRAKAVGRAGEIVTLDCDPVPMADADAAEDGGLHQILVAGIGTGSVEDARAAGAAAARRASAFNEVLVAAGGFRPDRLRAFVEGWLLASYRFSRKSTPAADQTQHVVLLGSWRAPELSAARRALRQAVATAEAVSLARDLANMPSNEKSPLVLAERAREVATTSGLTCRVIAGQDLADQGFGGLTAVGAGSMHDAALVVLEYAPSRLKVQAPTVVLVGKGVTFDSGGLSLKPPDGMVAMKTDMAGTAAVLGTMSQLKALGVKAKVVGLLALAENMPSGTAFRPGDVITQYGGTTVEIANTDAEGRLVLADALAYADQHLEPDVLVDIATLTGAATVGLGRHHGALYASQPSLSRAFVAAGRASGEQVWPMPLVEEYRSALTSQIADLRHVGSDPKFGGGSITAALFLREFVGERAWVHLDIAGPGRSDSDRGVVSRGGTGFGARVILRWLEALN